MRLSPEITLRSRRFSQGGRLHRGMPGRWSGRSRSAGVEELGMYARVLQEPGRPRGLPKQTERQRGRRNRNGPGRQSLHRMTARSEQEVLMGYVGVKKKMPTDGCEESELASSTVEAGELDRWDPGEERRQWSERASGGDDVRDLEPGKQHLNAPREDSATIEAIADHGVDNAGPPH